VPKTTISIRKTNRLGALDMILLTSRRILLHEVAKGTGPVGAGRATVFEDVKGRGRGFGPTSILELHE